MTFILDCDRIERSSKCCIACKETKFGANSTGRTNLSTITVADKCKTPQKLICQWQQFPSHKSQMTNGATQLRPIQLGCPEQREQSVASSLVSHSCIWPAYHQWPTCQSPHLNWGPGTRPCSKQASKRDDHFPFVFCANMQFNARLSLVEIFCPLNPIWFFFINSGTFCLFVLKLQIWNRSEKIIVLNQDNRVWLIEKIFQKLGFFKLWMYKNEFFI